MSETLNNITDIDSLLDGTLDDLADMPEFKPFPAGSHRATISWAMKEISKQQCPEVTFKAIETVELADATDVPVAAGDSTSVAFMFKKADGTPNELSQGQFKEVMKALAATYGLKSPRELMEESKGAEVLVTTKIRQDKRDPKDVKNYTQIVNVAVL